MMSDEQTTIDGPEVRADVMKRLCRLLWEVREAKFPGEACDCFCDKNGPSRAEYYRNEGASLAWLEGAVRERLAKDAAP